MADEYRRFWITSSGAIERERLLAEAFEAGAAGAEEQDTAEGFRAGVYAAADAIDALREAICVLADAGTEVGSVEAMPEVDWSEAWKEGLEALRISSRLVVRPPFVEWALEPGQKEIVIEPGQAFGTGSHGSTRLCLEWIDAFYAGAEEPDGTQSGEQPTGADRYDRVLDVGTGTGVLAFAAVALGARSAVGFDLDPVAIEAARAAAENNGLSDRVQLETGGIESEALPPGSFPLVLANLLKQEILPIADAVAARVSPGGRLVLAGLLEEDGPAVLARFRELGLEEAAPRREFDDAIGCWIGLCLERPAQSFASQSS